MHGATEVYQRGASLLERAGLLADAVRAYALAEDFASVARLVQHRDAGPFGDRIDTLDLPADDAWLTLARARRLHCEGSLAEAVAAFRHAETLLNDADFQQRCRSGRAAAALWQPDGSRFAQRRRGADPAAAFSTDAEVLRAATRHVEAVDDESISSLVRGLALLLAGEVEAATETLARVPTESAGDRLAADLALTVTELPVRGADGLLGRLEEIVLRADLADHPWLARLARGCECVVLVTTEADAWRTDSCSGLIAECRRKGDEWGATLLSGALGMALSRRRPPEAEAWFARAAKGAEQLDAPVLQAWATAMQAVLTRHRSQEDDADLQARARRLGRQCGVASILDRAQHLLMPRPAVSGTSARPDRSRDEDPGSDPGVSAGVGPGWKAPGGPLVRLRCLGTFQIEHGGVPVDLTALRPLPHTLLMLLALHHGRDLHREVLIDLLWPGTSVEAAAHRLHAAASSVRRCLLEAGLGTQDPTESVLRRRGNAYHLEVPDASHDVVDFDRLHRRGIQAVARGVDEAALAALVSALDLYRGDLLPGAGPAEWVVQERERLRVAAATAAYAAGRLALRIRVVEEALQWAQRATTLDPLRDSAWALLAEVQTRMGDVTAAAATRAQHAAVSAEVGLQLS